MRNSAMAASGLAFLSSITTLHALTSSPTPFEGYNPYAESKTDLRTSTLFGKHLSVSGKVYDPSGNIPQSNVLVEIWHLSPNSKKYRHRTKIRTDENGDYNFITDYPNNEEAKLPKVFFKLSSNNDSYFTELILTDTGANITGEHFARNKNLGKKLLPQKETILNQSKVKLNFTL